jgi:hypothetical protein
MRVWTNQWHVAILYILSTIQPLHLSNGLKTYNTSMTLALCKKIGDSTRMTWRHWFIFIELKGIFLHRKEIQQTLGKDAAAQIHRSMALKVWFYDKGIVIRQTRRKIGIQTDSKARSGWKNSLLKGE